MNRRQFLAGAGSAGALATAGCSGLGGSTTLSDPRVKRDAPGRRSLHFETDGGEVASLGVDGTVGSGVVALRTELSHREGTRVNSIRLRVWMPPRDAASTVAVVSPVSGDSSPPPSVSLYTPRRTQGSVIEVTDLDDLADETISTLELLVRPHDESDTRLFIDATIELADTGWFGRTYTLEGDLELSFPALAGG